VRTARHLHLIRWSCSPRGGQGCSQRPVSVARGPQIPKQDDEHSSLARLSLSETRRAAQMGTQREEGGEEKLFASSCFDRAHVLSLSGVQGDSESR